MKRFNKILLQTSIILFFLSIIDIMAADVYRPRYLVDDQPIPPVISINCGIPLMHNYFNYTNQSNDRAELKQSHSEMESFILPVVSKRNLLIILGPGYMGDRFYAQSPSVLPEYMSGIYFSFFATGSVHDSFYWITYQSYGLFNSQFKNNLSGSGKYYQFTNLGYKWNSSLSTYIGILYNTNFGNNIILPLLGIGFSWNDWIVDFLLPARADIRYIITDYLHALFSVRFLMASYRNNESTNHIQYIQINRLEYSINLELKIYSWVWMKLGASYSGETNIEQIKPNKGKIGSVDPEAQIALGFTIRPN
jgi:hypothetical protein